MDAEDPLFILLHFWFNGKPEMVHTTAGYMVYPPILLKNVFNYEDKRYMRAVYCEWLAE
jgi:hypothetical protein